MLCRQFGAITKPHAHFNIADRDYHHIIAELSAQEPTLDFSRVYFDRPEFPVDFYSIFHRQDMPLLGSANIEVWLKEGQTLAQVTEKGAYIRRSIENMGLDCLGSTRGLGMMIGVEVKGDKTNKELAAKLVESGLLILTAGPDLRLLPPLVVTKEEMDKGLEIMKAALA